MNEINIKINGIKKKITYKKKIFLINILDDYFQNYKKLKIAVALNNKLIVQNKWHEVCLKDQDSIEIVKAFPGG
tara:strand:- start:166 stop:387 length:222 start_codon:yes stop_codon:yes gene_type:complete